MESSGAPVADPTVDQAAQYLLDRFGPQIAALMAYGSRVCGQARVGSEYDFWLIYKDAETFHRGNAEFYRTQLNIASTPEQQIALNRTGPLFYAIHEDPLRIKMAVMEEADFARLCHSPWWTVKGRMQKPMRVIRMSPAVDEAMRAARREGLICALGLVPVRFTMDDFLHALVSLSYRAEVRPENKTAKIQSIIDGGRKGLEEIYAPLLAELPYIRREDSGYVDTRPPDERARARGATLRSLRRSKWSAQSLRFIWRNFRSHRTPIRYILLKVVGEVQKAFRRWFGRRG